MRGTTMPLSSHRLGSGPRGIGFTLIELLVVISIISLLIAILMPALTKAREASRAVVCGSNMRQIATAVELYAGDHNGFAFPTLIGPTFHTYKVAWYSAHPSPERSFFATPYLGQPRPTEQWAGRAFDCPTIERGYGDLAVDYTYNATLGTFGEDKAPRLTNMHSEFVQPSTVISFGESTGSRYFINTSFALWDDPAVAAFPHDDAANYSFLDGHVSRHKLGELVRDNIDP